MMWGCFWEYLPERDELSACLFWQGTHHQTGTIWSWSQGVVLRVNRTHVSCKLRWISLLIFSIFGEKIRENRLLTSLDSWRPSWHEVRKFLILCQVNIYKNPVASVCGNQYDLAAGNLHAHSLWKGTDFSEAWHACRQMTVYLLL